MQMKVKNREKKILERREKGRTKPVPFKTATNSLNAFSK